MASPGRIPSASGPDTRYVDLWTVLRIFRLAIVEESEIKNTGCALMSAAEEGKERLTMLENE